MEKQKICIIGGNLTGLATAICLSRLNCKIDLVTGNIGKSFKSSRTIAISEENLDFLSKLNIYKSLKKEIWSCSIMKLYAEIKNKKFLEIFELNNDNKEKKVLHMIENSKMMKLMFKKINKINSISLIKNKMVTSIFNSGLLKGVKFKNNISKYNLVIICAGYNSALLKNFSNDQVIENSYKEIAITTILKHDSCKNNIVRQIFLENGILAFLPISKDKTSIVWSIKNNIIKKDEFFLKKKIFFYAKNYLKNIKFLTKMEHKNLNLLIRNKYYSDRILLFGDALHVIHPFLGQGFNMTIRDLISLEKILLKKINLGLDIGSLDVLSEFSNNTKARNFAFSLGSDILKNSLSNRNLRNDMFKILNKSNFAKNILFNIADKGLRF